MRGVVEAARARIDAWHAALAVALVAAGTWMFLEAHATPAALLGVVFVALFALLIAFAVRAAQTSGRLTAPADDDALRHGPPEPVATRALSRRVRANGSRAPGAVTRRMLPAR